MRALDLPAGPWIAGHRGAAGERLENTLEAVRRAVEAGVQMVEVDLRMTWDGVPVLFHDATLERLTGRPGAVEGATWKELQGLTLRAEDGGGQRIPSLRELLAAVSETVPLNLELKRSDAGRRRFARRLMAALDGRGQALVSSFDWELLAAVRRLAPTLPLAPISRNDREGLLAAGRTLEAWSLHCHHRLARRRLLEDPRRDGRPVLAYTVNEPRRARHLLRRGVRGLFTDLPTRMVRALECWPP